MKCRICGTETNQVFSAEILAKYDIKYHFCQNCSFLQTEDPYWLEEAYEYPINVSDTGYVERNLRLSKKLSLLLALFFDKNAKYVDYAGGYGLLVRLMRDIGFDFYWYDKYTQNMFSQGFEFEKQQVDAVTIFECFEHFVNPIDEIEALFKLSDNIIFSTQLLPEPVPKPQKWWYYGLEHGQHIAFYSDKTMRYLGKRFEKNYYNFGDLQIFTTKKLPKISKYLLKATKLGIQNVFLRNMESKIWKDHNKVSGYK